MAIAIPLLLGAAGVSTAVAAGVGLAFAVTGINKKIDQAAASVFGEDLVKVANIAGIAYGAYQSGVFSGEGLGGAAGEAASTAAGSADAAFDVLGGAYDAASTVAPASFDVLGGAYDVASTAPGGFNLAAENAASSGSLIGSAPGTAAPAAGQTGFSMPMKSAVSVPGLRTTSSLAPASASTNNLYSLSTPATQTSAIMAKAGPANIFERLAGAAMNPQVVGGVLQGAAGAYTAAQQRDMQQQQFDLLRNDRMRNSNIGSAGFRLKSTRG